MEVTIEYMWILMLQTEVITVMTPMLNSLLEQFSVILQPPVQPEDPDDWGIRMEVDTS